jgi:hypothetical protein
MRKFLGELIIAKGLGNDTKVADALREKDYRVMLIRETEDFKFYNIMDNEEINPDDVSFEENT